MILFSIRKIREDDRALINVLREKKNCSSKRLLRKFSGKNWAWTSVDRLLKKIILLVWQNIRKTVTVCDQFARRNFGKIELVEELIYTHESVLRVNQSPYEIGRKTNNVYLCQIWCQCRLYF